MASNISSVVTRSQSFPRWIYQPWRSLTIVCIVQTNKQSETKVTVDEEIRKYQFLLACYYHRLESTLKLYEIEIGVKQDEEHSWRTCCVTVKTFTKKNDLKSLFVDVCFNEFLRDCTTFTFDLDVGEAANVKRKLQEGKPGMIESKEAALFIEDNKIVCIASNEKNLHNTLRQIGYMEIQRVATSSYEENLFLLGITAPNMFPNVKIESEKQFLNFIWSGRADTTAEEIIKEFLKRCTKSTVTFDRGHDACMLIFDEKGNINNTFIEYVISKCKSMHIHAPYFNFRKEKDDIILYAQPANEFNQLKDIIEKSIIVFTPAGPISQELQTYSQQHKCKIWLDNYKNIVVCTDDLRNVVGEFCDKCVTGKVSEVLSSGQSQMVDFFTRQGDEFRRHCRSKFQVDILVDKRIVVLQGNCRPDIDNCKAFIKKWIKDVHSIISFDGKCLEELKTDCQNLAQEDKLCWRVHLCNKSLHIELSAEGWEDPYGALHICLQEGDFDVSTDLFVELVSDKLIPLTSAFSKTEHPLHSVNSTATFNANVKDIYKHKLCGTFSNGKMQCKDVWSVVCVKGTDNTVLDSINNRDLRSALKHMFVYAQHQKHRKIFTSVCLKEYIADNLNEVEIVKQLVEAGITYVKTCYPSDRKMLVIHVNKRNMVASKSTIDQTFATEFPTYTSIPKHVAHSSPTIMIKVETGNIQNAKACVIVNSTDEGLEFKGSCAKEIKSAGGESLETECRIKYPDGVQPGFVAFTKSHGLAKNGIRYLFHIALKQYTGTVTMVQDVVIRCLNLANELQCSKIAFPALGVGALEYPWRETAYIMFEAVEHFSKVNPGASIKEVQFICHEKDHHTCNAFENEGYRRSKECNLHPGTPIDTTAMFHSLVGRKGRTEVRVLRSRAYCAFPSYAVEVSLNRGPTKSIAKASKEKVKEARLSPCTWNDIIVLAENPETVLRTVVDERITHLIWNLDHTSKKSIVDQIDVIVRSLDFLCDTCSNKWLRTVDVVVDKDSILGHEEIATNNTATYTLELTAESKDTLARVQDRVIQRLQGIRNDKLTELLKSLYKQPCAASSLNDQSCVPNYVMAAELDTPTTTSGSTKQYQPLIIPSATAKTDTSTKYVKKRLFNERLSLPGDTPSLSDGTTPCTFPKIDVDSSSLDSRQLAATAAHSMAEESRDNNMMLFEVSAEINTGIIRFLAGDVSSWIEDMQHYFSVAIEQHEGDCATARGTFGAIARFEEYLNTSFPRGADGLDLKENHFENITKVSRFINSYRYEYVCKDVGYHYTIKYNYENGCLQAYGHEQEVDDLVTRINRIVTETVVFDKPADTAFAMEKLQKNSLLSASVTDAQIIFTGFYPEVKKAFESLSYSTKEQHVSCDMKLLPVILQVERGDIRNVDADILVISSTPKMIRQQGAAMHVHEMLRFDDMFQRRCKISVEKHKLIKPGECRVIESGLGVRRWIGHIYLARSQSGENPQYQLERAIQNCLEEAEKRQCQKMAFTCIGSDRGNGELSVQICVNCYWRAISSFNSIKHLNTIIFVEKNKEVRDDVLKTFKSYGIKFESCM